MDGGDKDSLEWKEDERTSESAGEWIELEFMIYSVREKIVCDRDYGCGCFCLLLFKYVKHDVHTIQHHNVGVRVATPSDEKCLACEIVP